MLIEFIILLVVFLVLSILAFMGKLTSFITGNKAGENKDNVYNNRSASKFIGLIMSLLVVATTLGILGFVIADAKWLIVAAPILFSLVLIFAIIFINTNNRFVDEVRTPEDASEDKEQ